MTPITKPGSLLGIDLPAGTRVRLYKNLNNGKVSVQTKIPGKGWRVFGYTDKITIANAKFIVMEAARQRVIKIGHREVHAYVEGELTATKDLPIRVSYNPFNHDHFYYAYPEMRGDDITEAALVTCTDGFAWVSPR